MKWIKWFGICVILLSVTIHEPVLARGGHGGGHFGGHFGGWRGGHWHGGSRFGFYFGPGFGYYGGGYGPYGGWGGWGYPYYYPPAVVAVPTKPPVYIEQGSAQQENYWYYCPESQTYYPYVRDCPAGWQRVPAQPAQR